ncbi:hypothetical protein LSCM4_08279 [Leishmania orientalis]|uniref:6-phosphofructo-2-kinase domain-containing protein n=1 Tax=Leishmania orientalis TaxID=2249476 RepID=A0A836H8Z6_9TRYP|nr:hypothetical protein LSCM4_08279 [Leishmania orientalis]
MSEARASPAVAHPRGVGHEDDVAEGHNDSGHLCRASPPHQQHEQSRPGYSPNERLKSPPSPADVGLEPPLWCCVSSSTPAPSLTARTPADPEGHRYSRSASDSGHGTRSPHSSVSLASPTTANSHGQSSSGEAPLYGTGSACGTGGRHEAIRHSARTGSAGRHEHPPAGAAQYTPVYVNASLSTTSPAAARSRASRTSQHPCRKPQSTPVLTASSQAWHWGAAPAVAAAFQQRQQQSRCRQRRAVAGSREGTLDRRGGRHVPAPLFSNVPTTAAMGAAVAARAQRSASNSSTAVSSPASKAPLQRATSMSSCAGCLPAVPPGVESPVTPGSSAPTEFPSGSSVPALAPATELMRSLTYAEEAPMSLTNGVHGEGAPSQRSESHIAPHARLPKRKAVTAATPPSACTAAVSSPASAGAAAPSHSCGEPRHSARPRSRAQAGGHRLGPATGGTAADGAKAEDEGAATGAAGRPHLVATSQTEHSEDSRDGLLRVASFRPGKESSLYNLVDSHQASESKWPFFASVAHEEPVKAAAAVDGTFTGTEAHTALGQHCFGDACNQKAPQLLGTAPATASGDTFSWSRATGDSAVSGNYINSRAAHADIRRAEHRAGVGGCLTISSHYRRTDSEHSGHGSLTMPGISVSASAGQRKSTAAGGRAGIGSASSASMLKRSLTEPSLTTVKSSAAASGGLSGYGIAVSPRSLAPQQHVSDPSVLSIDASLTQPTTTATSNSFWSSSSANVNAVSNSSIPGIAGAASAIGVGGGGLVSLVSNSPAFLPGGSFAIAASAPTTRDPLAASVTQQSRSALIAELQRRRQRLQKQLALLQKEATAHNIFALVRASNASQLQYLLREGLCNVTDRDYNGCTPLHVAAGEGNQAVVRVLLSFGADVVAVDNNGRTPLDCAAANRHSGVARYLLTLIRSKHFSHGGGGDGGFTSSGGDDGPPEAMCCAKPTTGESSVVAGECASLTTSPLGHPLAKTPVVKTAGGVLPLGASASGLSAMCTATSLQRSNSAQQLSVSSGSSLNQSPALLQPLSRQSQQQRHLPSSSSAASTPSPSRPPNWKRPPANLAASYTTTDAESWSDSDVPPHAAVWGAKATAAAGTAATDSASRASTPKVPSSPTMHKYPGPSSRALPLLSTAANKSLAGYESPASMLTPLCSHGSSPQKRVVLSLLDSAAAAHSRGLIAAEANACAASMEPSSTCINSSPPQLPTSAAVDTSPAAAAVAGRPTSHPMLPPPSSLSQLFSSRRTQEDTAPRPSTKAVSDPDINLGNSSAGSGGRCLAWRVVSGSPNLADRIKGTASEDTSQVAAASPPSRAHTTTPLITAAGAMTGWHDGDERLADTDFEGIEDVLGRRGHLSMRRRRMLSESGNSAHGGFASVSSDSLQSGSSRTLAERKDTPHSRRDRSNFSETGSLSGEVPVAFSSPPARTAASGAAASTACTQATLAATPGGNAQQRQMLLRPPRRPDSSPAATDQRGTTLAAEADRYPVSTRHPLKFRAVDPNAEWGNDRGCAARPTVVTPPAATKSVAIPAYSSACSGLKCQEELTSSTVASCAGSLRGAGARSSSICDMGQQSLEEHQHYYRMTTFGMRGNQRQPRGGSDFGGDPTLPPLLQPTRVTLESTGMKAAVTRPSTAAAAAAGPTVAAPTSSSNTVAAAAARVPTALASTTATPPATTAPALAAAAATTPTADRHSAGEQFFPRAEQHKPADLAALHYSSYTTISDAVSIIVCMVGLPGRGKSFISKRLMRYINWKGVPCRVFNAGNYRRQLLGVETTAGADFFDPSNPKGAQLRERMAELACEDLVSFIASHSLAVGILDATNTTRKRRAWLSDYFQQEAQRYALPYRLLFIESVCNDDAIVTENILRSKCDNDDFKSLNDVSAVISEFRNRILQYEKVYETLEAEERMPYIKIVDVKRHVILHRVPNGLGSRIAFFLLNLHPIAFPIYVALPGETVGDSRRVYGGEERLTVRGEAYAIALKRFIQDRYVPHMVILHATNYCVLSTLAPLMEGPAEEEGEIILKAPSVANGPGASAGDSCGTSKTATPASQHPHSAGGRTRYVPRVASAQPPSATAAATRSTPAPADAVEATDSRFSMQNASSEVARPPSLKHTLAPASASHRPASQHYGSDDDSNTSESSSRHSLPSRDGRLHEQHACAPSTITEELRAREGGGLGVASPQRGTVPGAKAAVAGEQLMQEDDSDRVDDEEGEIGDEVLCPVPGLDNINFGRFSGHTAAWVREKYPRLSALLYDVNDGDVMSDARDEAEAPPQRQHHPCQPRESGGPADASDAVASAGSAKATTGASHHHIDQRSGACPTAEWLSAPLPPPVHYATHEEAVSHLQRAFSGADPCLSYCTQLPNGESYRQVNVRLEPALMAVMRTQSPVFVVAPAVPAQGILSFFMDVIPELSPTIRIPRGCVVEIGVKDSITVHPLLPDSLPESMTRSPLTVLPEIQEAIREVAAASSMERRAERERLPA